MNTPLYLGSKHEKTSCVTDNKLLTSLISNEPETVLALPDTKHSRTDLLFSLPFEKTSAITVLQQFHYNSCNIHSLQLVEMDRARVASPMPNC